TAGAVEVNKQVTTQPQTPPPAAASASALRGAPALVGVARNEPANVAAAVPAPLVEEPTYTPAPVEPVEPAPVETPAPAPVAPAPGDDEEATAESATPALTDAEATNAA